MPAFVSLYRTLGARELLFSTPFRCAFFSRAKVSDVIPLTSPGHKTNNNIIYFSFLQPVSFSHVAGKPIFNPHYFSKPFFVTKNNIMQVIIIVC